jgi:hypothetical protein
MPEALLLVVDVDARLNLRAKGFLFTRGRGRFQCVRVRLKR